MKRVYQVQHPEIFQGTLQKKSYFEGWYHKLVSLEKNQILAIIPGVALPSQLDQRHAFIQILDGITAEYHYLSYPLSTFNTAPSQYFVKIGQNTFSIHGIKLDIHTADIKLRGKISYKNFSPLPYRGISPGAMGWFSFFPGMECNHGIVSMNHKLEGYLKYNKESIDYSGGKGYIEKDWGKSFPSHWIWMQTNHFSEPRRSFMFSLARIPYLNHNFTGLLGILYNKGKFYRFATYNLAKYRLLQVSPRKVKIEIFQGKFALLIEAKKEAKAFERTAVMKAPHSGIMTGKCIETISATIKISLFHYLENSSGSHWKLLFSDIGRKAGLEIMGTKISFH